MKITIGIPILNQFELTVACLKLIEKNSKKIDEIIIVDNGSDSDFLAFKGLQSVDSNLINKLKIIKNPYNFGVREALNQIYYSATGDIILYTHNDVEIFEKDFDEKIRNTFKNNSELAIVGAYGAKGIGTSDIYISPYNMNQLARHLNVSNARMDKNIHGFRNLSNDFENVAVFDGMFMAIKKQLLDITNGFSDILPQHHNYDNLICIQSLENGFENIVIPLDINHLGGRTDVGEDWTKGLGKSKQDIHTDAHPPLYEYGRGKLPIWIEDIYSEDNKICGYQLYMNNKLVKERIYEQ